MTHHRSTYVTAQLPQSALSVLYRTVWGGVKFSIAVLVLTFLPFLSACTEDDPSGPNPANTLDTRSLADSTAADHGGLTLDITVDTAWAGVIDVSY